MARKKRRRRSSTSTLVRFENSPFSTRAGNNDAALFHLAARMRVAEQTLNAAMTALATAEQRLLEGRTEERSGRRKRLSCHIAAEAKEEAAGNALEVIYQQIAETPAHTKAGLAIKLQLTAMLYGENLEDHGNADMVSQLLQSLIADTSGQH
jgi:hypothetical protein